MKIVVFLLVSILFLACRGEKNQEPLDMSDIIPSSERYKEGDTLKSPSPKVMYFDSLGSFAKLVSDTLGIGRETVFIPDSVFFPDRFISKSKEKWEGLIGGSLSNVGLWTYNDSLETKNALFNWLDCFGKRCESLKLFEEKRISKASFLIYTTEKKMVYISSSTGLDIQQLLVNLNRITSREKILYVISQGIGMKATWWEFLDKKWIIKKKVE